jgi:hypothetical protein
MLCIGCQGIFPDTPSPDTRPTHEYVLSSPGCWAVYGEVLAREYSNPTLMRLHKLTVDTYAVQHPGIDVPPARRSVAIHLSRLYLFIERRLPIEQVEAAMPRILAIKDQLPWLTPPSMQGALTIQSLADASPSHHEAALLAWAQSVWTAWTPHQPTIRQHCAGF